MTKALRLQKILYSARKVFSEKGYHRASVEDIIKEAGISRGTFYNYFKSKREIFGHLLGSLTGALTMNIQRVDVSPGAPPIVEQMMGNVERILSTLLGNLDLTKILLREAVGIDPDFDAKLNEFYEGILALIELSLKHGQEMGIIRECNISVASYLILGGIRQSMEVFLDAKHKRLSPSELGKNLFDILAKGLFVKM